MNQRVWKAVQERSGGRCESCSRGSGNYGQTDHFFGRARAEGVESCWLLCMECHYRKTNNQPSARFWLEMFVAHCAKHGYEAARERATKRLEGIVAVREFEMAKARGVQ